MQVIKDLQSFFKNACMYACMRTYTRTLVTHTHTHTYIYTHYAGHQGLSIILESSRRQRVRIHVHGVFFCFVCV